MSTSSLRLCDPATSPALASIPSPRRVSEFVGACLCGGEFQCQSGISSSTWWALYGCSGDKRGGSGGFLLRVGGLIPTPNGDVNVGFVAAGD